MTELFTWRLGRVVLAPLFVLAIIAPAQSVGAQSRPSFECWWTEPFDGFQVSPSGAVYLSSEDGEKALVKIVVRRTGSGFTISGYTAESVLITVKITKDEGNDGMSDYTTEYRGELGSMSGSCVRYAEGTRPRRVVGVAESDVLNVREKPAASAKVLTSLPPKSSAFVYPGKPSKGWYRVSARKFPPNESGRITVVNGWVNGAFLE